MWRHALQALKLLPLRCPCLHINGLNVYGVEAPVSCEAAHHGQELRAWVVAQCEQLLDTGHFAVGHDELLQVALLIRVHGGKLGQADATQGQGLHPSLLHPQQHDAPKCPDRGVLLLAVTGHWTREPGHPELQSPDDGTRSLHLPTGICTPTCRETPMETSLMCSECGVPPYPK